jgi:class 3 adenylate cyclase
MDREIRFCTTAHGVSIAYAASGTGPPLVVPPGWVSHLESPLFLSDLLVRLSKTHTVIAWDKQRTGLSSREISEFSVESGVAEAEAVMSDLNIDAADLLGVSQGGPIAVAFAALHPERVRRLGLFATYADGPGVFYKPEVSESMLSVVRSHWGIGSKVLTDMFMPGASEEEGKKFARYQREAATSEVAAGYLRLVYDSDVTEQAAQIDAPTLIMHAQGDRAIPIAGGRQLAALIRRARFVPLDSSLHIPDGETAELMIKTMDEFFAGDEPSPSAQGAGHEVQTILFTDLESSTALTQRVGDEAAQEVLHGHNTAVRGALDANGGREVKHTGDGIMAAFTSAVSAVSAVQAGIAMQRELASGEVRVRIGINAGEPVAEDDDFFGTAVQLAARIVDRAEPGQVVLSNVVRELCAGKTFEFTSQGEVTLKGFDEPVTLYEVRPRA